MSLFSELKRRNVLRMTALYVIAAWLVMQVAEVIIGLAGLPEWVGQTVLVLLAIGFPIALLFSWFYELTPEGLSLEKDVAAGESITQITGRRMDIIVIAVLCAAVILLAVDKWWVPEPAIQSVAVLPFANMSGDPDQEYFSDGVSEQVLNLLTRVPGLKVIARTSSFSFKHQDLETQEIAQALGVRHLIQGSVRQSGNTVRINAQLVKADDSTPIWSETYERALRDIFAVQDEIAASVTLAFGLAVSEDLLKSTRVDPEAYKQMLRSRFLIYRGAAGDVEAALEAAKSAVAMAPDYAEAWSELSLAYGYMAFYGNWPREKADDLQLEAMEMALAIDPRSANAHSRLGQVITLDGGDLALAAEHMNKALAIEPDNAIVLGGSGLLALELGRLEQAITVSQRALEIDPLSPMSHAGMCRAYYYAGQFAKALDSCRKTLKLSPEHWVKHRLLPWSLLFAGELDSLEEAEREGFDVQVRDFTRMAILHTLGEEQRFDQEFAEYREKYENFEPYRVAYVYVMLGMTDEAFECLDRITSESIKPYFLHIEPRLKPLHGDPRWRRFVERLDRNPEKLDKIELKIPASITPD